LIRLQVTSGQHLERLLFENLPAQIVIDVLRSQFLCGTVDLGIGAKKCTDAKKKK
jgi:hypothetical protein